MVQRAFWVPQPLVDQTVSECDRALGGLLAALAAGRPELGCSTFCSPGLVGVWFLPLAARRFPSVPTAHLRCMRAVPKSGARSCMGDLEGG